MATDFSMPTVELGQDVWWYHSKDSEPAAAKVTRVGDRAVELVVYVPGYSNTKVPKGGAVPHLDDPRVRNNDGRGFWGHTDRQKKIDKLLSELVTMANNIPDE